MALQKGLALLNHGPSSAAESSRRCPQNCSPATLGGGISYADRDKSMEKHGDYRKIALLTLDTLELIVYEPDSPLLPMVREDAARIQARRGEEFPVSASQTVTLGYALKGTHA